MFLKFAWLEVAYCLVGHFTLLLWVSVVVRRVLLDGSKLPGLGADRLAWWIALSAAGILLVLFFCYSLFCSLAPILMIVGRYTLAERIYRRTLKMRQKAPFVGKTARVDFWNVSLANCYLRQKRYEEAENLYRKVLARVEHRSFIDRMTNHGLSDVARENYISLLRETGREDEAMQESSLLDGSANYMRIKYAFVCIVVLVLGILFSLWLDGALRERLGA